MSGEHWAGPRRAFRLPGARRRVKHEVDSELEFHIQGRMEELMAEGMSAREAEREARARFGDAERIGRELEAIDVATHRRRSRAEWLHDVRRDVRYAWRGILRRPLAAAIIVVTLALGIGANTAIFSVLDTVLLRPLGVPWLQDLFVIQESLPGISLDSAQLSPAETMDLIGERDLFVSSAGYSRPDYNLTGAGEPRRLAAVATLGRFFDTFGATPLHGSFYRPEDSENGRSFQVVLSHGLWQEITGGDPRSVGTTIQLNDEAYEIVGVLPPDFRYPVGAQLYLPFVYGETWKRPNRRGSLFITFVGRVRPGTTAEQLDQRLGAVTSAWHRQYAYGAHLEHHLLQVPFVTYIAGELRPILLMLGGAVAFVLLIACANVASLQLVRAIARGRELGIRAALGAGRGPIARQLFVESAVLGLVGGVVGLGVGWLVLQLIATTDAARFEMLRDVRLDSRVLGFTALITLGAAVLFGSFPALRASRVDLSNVLSDGGRGGTAGARQSRFLQGAVIVQVALALVLLLGSGLVIRSLRQLIEADPGFRAEGVYTMQLSLPDARYREGAQAVALQEQLIERLEAAPGVEHVGTVYGLPFSDLDNSSPFDILGRPEPAPGEPDRHARMYYAGGDYFRAMGMRVVRGRGFDQTDVASSLPVSVIDETLARQFFPNEDPIGKQIAQGFETTIVGVVSTVKKHDLAEADKATIYYPFSQRQWAARNMNVVVRSGMASAQVAPLMRRAVREIDPQLPVFSVMSMTERVERSLGSRRLAMGVLTGFAALALTLAMLGIYGVLSYGVSQRVQEIGIRMALGARPGDVVRMIVRGGAMLAAAGLIAGGVLYLALGRAVESWLSWGVGVRDPLTLGVGVAVLLGVALAAAWVPARRAARVDPVSALRAQ